MQQKAYYKEALTHPVFKTIEQAVKNLGIEAYVIGGFVRDYILERKKHEDMDIDIVVVGSGIDLANEVANLLPGKPRVSIFKRFGTAMIKSRGIELEFVGARKESYQENSRKPAVEEGSLEDDQNRRDFTINALALSLTEKDFGLLLDPFNGVEDLDKKLIRTPLDADITYSDDPLRMLRAIRFATQLDFIIEKDSLDAITRNKDRIKIVSKERIIGELNKIIAADKPSKGFALLLKTGLLQYILPELVALQGVDEKEGQRHKDNFWHTLEVLDNMADRSDNLWLRWAALLHDIGKAPTKRFDDKIGWTFHGHEFVGSKMVYRLFRRLRMPLNDKMKFVQKMVLMSSRPISIADEVSDSAVRRLIFDAGDHIEDLMLLCEADITTKNPRRYRKYHNNFKMVREKMKEVEERDRIRNFEPPVTGEEIMNYFGIRPSKEVGIIKDAIKNAILDGKIPNEKEAALEYMVLKATQIGLSPVN